MPPPVSFIFIISRFVPFVKRGRDITAENGKKMGRPTDDPKKLSTRIRLSEIDVKRLAYCSQKTGLTKAEIIRQGIQEVYEKLQK